MDLWCFSDKRSGSSPHWKYNTSFDDLPEGLVVDILSRLPVKALAQSIFVCKLWLFIIIKTPSFIPLHLSRSLSNPSSYYIFLSRDFSPVSTVISDNPLVTCHQDYKFPFETYSSYLELIGACNGLICVTDAYFKNKGRDLYLVNPFIRKYKKLGVESSCYADLLRGLIGEREPNSINTGFGYSEIEDDYKVLRIIKGSAWVCPCKVEIYSLKSGKWKAVDLSIALETPPGINPTFVHGCLYWSGIHLPRVEDHVQDDEYLLCFDLKDELFTRIELPKIYFQGSLRCQSGIYAKNGSLALVLCTDEPQSVVPFTMIWVVMLEKKSGGQIRWEEFSYICANFNPHHCIGFGAMGIRGGGRLLFVANTYVQPEYIVAIDLDNSCAIESLALDFIDDDAINEVINVSESLVLLSD